ncbi:MAG: SGNH/GDSL hydrolase family protein [Calditrichia bacterium]
MKKLVLLLLLAGILLYLGCTAENPEQPKLNILRQQLVLSKMAAVGNSLTAGFQSAGLKKEFQEHSYPNLIAKQMGNNDFQMPLISDPGIGTSSVAAGYASTPLTLTSGGAIVYDSIPLAQAAGLPSNTTLARPYDDMAVPGATLHDILYATTPTSSSNPSNLFFQIILRNVPTAEVTYPPFGNMTAIDQALLLNPSLLLLWIGNNDVLGAALSGTAVVGVTITPQADFEADFNQLIAKIRSNNPNTQIVLANIPNVTNIPYVNTIPPVVIDINTFQPVLINGQPVPWVTEETGVEYVLLSAIDELKAGIGVPAALGGTGTPLGGQYTLTSAEVQTIANAVSGFNSYIAGLGIPYMNSNKLLSDLDNGNITGFSGDFVLLAPGNTAFSLDGVHPNNAGYALVANEFIKVINTTYNLGIPEIDATQYLGQYTGTSAAKIAPGALKQVKNIFTRH